MPERYNRSRSPVAPRFPLKAVLTLVGLATMVSIWGVSSNKQDVIANDPRFAVWIAVPWGIAVGLSVGIYLKLRNTHWFLVGFCTLFFSILTAVAIAFGIGFAYFVMYWEMH
jgi:hypothetical protein